MAHQLDLKKKNYKHWVRAGLGIKYLKEGLAPFCDEVVERQQNDILDNIKQTKNLSTVTCGQCNLRELKPDHVRTGNRLHKKLCPLGQPNCNCLHPSAKQPCPNNVCGAIYDHIVINYELIGSALHWRNTDARRWCTDPWSIAKCFINRPGLEHKTSAAEIDCRGLLGLIINYRGFHNHIDGTDVFSEVSRYINEIFLSSSMELEENTANTYIDAMIAILQDGKELKTREYAQKAVQKLLMLKKDDVIITTKDELRLTSACKASISGRTEEFESKLQEMKELKTAQSRQRGQFYHIRSKHNLGNPHKRLKRSTMSSISSADEDQESVGDDTEQMSTYYKSGGTAGQSGWQDPNMDPVLRSTMEKVDEMRSHLRISRLMKHQEPGKV